MAAPRAPLVRRFGKELALRLDQALGRLDEALSPRLPVPELSAERRLAEPIMETGDIERIVLLLADSLRQSLERREAGALGLQLQLFRVDGVVARLSVGLSRPAREPDRIAGLFRERLAAAGASLDAGCGFDLVRLSVESKGPMPARQADFGEEMDSAETGLAQFVDRVRARLGRDVLRRPVAVASHLPERAVTLSARMVTSVATGLAHSMPLEAERPLRLLYRPEPVEVVAEVPEGPPLNFRWRRAQYRIARAEGPERISPEWWLEDLPEVEGKEGESDVEREERRRQAGLEKTARLTRDYYRVEDTEGRRYWLFRQGLYGATEQAPCWFLHGMFA